MTPAGVIALAAGDVNADGVLDVVTLGADGSIRRVSRVGDAWEQQEIAVRSDTVQGGAAATSRLFLADLDNNGALDLVASGGGRTRVWLANDRRRISRAAVRRPRARCSASSI